ncbi:helix-turn-helix domain-containing protein [Paenibacillus whitsoniae]|uniref:Helix-turn-helix domain-containing protein n=1 Tax=Paenibacillus whitsoniae TaxID=2496558 RepID=A0A3S0A6E7_9BACL|nr:helix-turn-helix domain-containing protein [Paenibacillus whitsoniae]RTE10658.1 helix-turn-helix domain-containing protein [Paenibacillus whitsoniae]
MKEKKEKRFLKSSLFEYFNYFLALSLLVAAISGGALYYSSSTLLWRDAIQNSSNTLNLIKNGQEIVLAEVDKAMEAVFLDSSFLHFMDYYEQADIYMQLQLRQRLENVVLSSDYIHSVSIYYTSSQMILSSLQGALPLSSFQDRDFIRSMVERTSNKSTVRTRFLPEISSAKEESVISIVKTLPVIQTGTPSAYVVINIKGNYLAQIMQSLSTNPDVQLVVTDQEGHILSQKAPEEETSDFGDFVSGLDISQFSETSGSLFTKVHGVDSLVCYVTSGTSGWVYTYMIPKSVVTHSLHLWSRLTVAICLMAVVLSLIGSLLLSRRIVNPMHRLLNMMRGIDQKSYDSKSEHAKEIVQIERSVSRLMDQNRDLTTLLMDYEIQSRNKFLQRLVCGDEQISPHTMERLTYYGLSLPETGSFVVLIVSMDEYSKFTQNMHESERNTWLLQLSERLQEEAFSKMGYQGYLVEAEPNEMVMVLYLAEEPIDSEMLPESLRSWLRQLLTLLGQVPTMTFTIGVSTLHTSIEELSECYQEAGSALRQKLVYGGNTVIYYEAVRPEAGIVMYPLGLEKQILTHFKTGNREGLISGLQEFEAHLIAHHARQIEVVRHYFLQLFSSSLRCVYEIDANLGFQPVIQQLRHTDLLEMETMQSMVSYMQVLYELVLDQLEQKRSMKNQELAVAITAYIDTHLADDLTIERLSEIFAISTSHMRKIYKDETGMTIKDRVSERRIAAARMLLGDQRLKIQEIADQVGYLTVQSFTKAFKMETGRTPGEYRAELLRVHG